MKFNQRLAYCCKFKKNWEGFIFVKIRSCVISRKYHSRQLATFLQFADAGKSCSSCDFYVAKMSRKYLGYSILLILKTMMDQHNCTFLQLITYFQKPSINVNAGVFNRARPFRFDLSLHLQPHFVNHASIRGPDKSAHTRRLTWPLLLQNVIGTEFSCVSSYHTGKCIRRFAGIYAYCRYCIDRKW